MISPELERHAAAIEHARTSTPEVVRWLALALTSRANGPQGVTMAGRRWRARRHAEVRQRARSVLVGGTGGGWGLWDWPGAVVRIVRVAPRRLDDDNAVAAAKSVRDGVADALGVHDRDPRVAWLVDQELGAPAVRVELYRWDAGVASLAPRGATKRSRPMSGHGRTNSAQPRGGQRPSAPMTKVSQSLFHP